MPTSSNVDTATSTADGGTRRAPPSVVIVGGGIAGVTLADALLTGTDGNERLAPHQLTLVTHADSRAGSSAPGALLHVSPGRSFDISAEQAEAFSAAQAWLREQTSTCVEERPLVRPCSGPTGARLARSLERARPMLERAGVTVDVVDRPAAAALFGADEMAPGKEFFVVRPSFAVALSAMLDAAHRRLTSSGVTVVAGECCAVSTDPNGRSTVSLVGGHHIRAAAVVLACGRGLIAFDPTVGEREGGDLVTVKPSAEHSPSSAMLTAGGIHGCGPSGVGWAVGATRYRLDAMPTVDEATASLVQRWNAVAPDTHKISRDAVTQLWRGERLVGHGATSTGDPSRRRAVSRRLTPDQAVWVHGGFGGTGLLWAPLFARRLAAEILGADAV